MKLNFKLVLFWPLSIMSMDVSNQTQQNPLFDQGQDAINPFQLIQNNGLICSTSTASILANASNWSMIAHDERNNKQKKKRSKKESHHKKSRLLEEIERDNSFLNAIITGGESIQLIKKEGTIFFKFLHYQDINKEYEVRASYINSQINKQLEKHMAQNNALRIKHRNGIIDYYERHQDESIPTIITNIPEYKRRRLLRELVVELLNGDDLSQSPKKTELLNNRLAWKQALNSLSSERIDQLRHAPLHIESYPGVTNYIRNELYAWIQLKDVEGYTKRKLSKNEVLQICLLLNDDAQKSPFKQVLEKND